MPHTDFTDAVKPEKVRQDRKEASIATVLNDIQSFFNSKWQIKERDTRGRDETHKPGAWDRLLGRWNPVTHLHTMAGERMLSHLIDSIVFNQQTIKIEWDLYPSGTKRSRYHKAHVLYFAEVAGQLFYDRVRCTVYVYFIRNVFLQYSWCA